MNKEDLILRCLSILLSDPDGNNGEIRMMLMKEITDTLHPKSDSEDCCDMVAEKVYCTNCLVLHSPENCPNKEDAQGEEKEQ